MDDMQRKQANTIISVRCFDLLRDGPLTLAKLTAALHRDSVFDQWVDIEPELPEFDLRAQSGRENFVDDFLQLRDDFMYDELSDQFFSTTTVLDQRVVTHRFTDAEIDGDYVVLSNALDVLDLAIDHNRLLFGGEVSQDFVLGEGDRWQGPKGWLSDFVAGELGAITRDFDDLVLTEIDEAALEEPSVEIDEILGWFDGQPRGIRLEAWIYIHDSFMLNSEFFAKPVLPFDELMAQAGLVKDAGKWVVADSDGNPIAEPRDGEIEDLASYFGLGQREVVELERVIDAWHRYSSSASGPAEIDVLGTADSLAYTFVAIAFESYVEDRFQNPVYESFLSELVEGKRRSTAAAHFLLGRLMVFGMGSTIGGIEAYKASARADAEYVNTQLALSEVEFYEGKFDSAVRRVRDFDVGRELEALVPVVAAPPVTAGRNDPCPCGSGRKFKACHQGKGTSGDAPVRERVGAKMQRFLMEEEQIERTNVILGLLIGDFVRPTEADIAHINFGLEIACHEGGLWSEFLDLYGVLLRPDEFAFGIARAATTRELFEIEGVVPGESIDLRDVRSGETVTIIERTGSNGVSVGQYVLARIIEDESDEKKGPVLDADPQLVDMRHRDEVLAALDSDEPLTKMFALAGWYSSMLAPPQIALSDSLMEALDDADVADILSGEIWDRGVDVAPYEPPEPGTMEFEVLTQYMAEYEANWMHESIPLLGGATPTEAASDPTRRDDLVRLLDSMPQTADPCRMSGLRLRQALGLD